MEKSIENFSETTIEFLKEKQEFISEEFFDRNLIRQSISSGDISNIKEIYYSSLIHLCKGKIKEFCDDYKRLANLYIKLEVPYIVLVNEINHLQHILMDLFIGYDKKDEIITIYNFSVKIQNIIAKEYFSIYAKSLISICNCRLSSLSDMIEKFVVDHYANHLKWLIQLSKSLIVEDTNNFPQTDKTICSFGKWLTNDAKSVIKNNSKLKELERVHSQLHYVALQIKQIMIATDKIFDYDILFTYLEKCELLSLSIGTELALIDNTIINQNAIKDTLTGAIGRQGLSRIFQNQYELSQATSSKFVIAHCDLDFFKNVNDTYGHIAGDKMLQGFVKVVKSNIRSSDIIIRYGGEEFVLILPAINKHQAFIVLEKIRVSFEQFILRYEQNDIKATVSIGTYEIEAEEKYSDDLLDEYIDYADKKLYKAKHDGRNRIK